MPEPGRDYPDREPARESGEGEAGAMTKRHLASRIADTLFTNGSKQKAERLVLELGGKRDGGGWCKSAAIDAIERILKAGKMRRTRGQ